MVMNSYHRPRRAWLAASAAVFGLAFSAGALSQSAPYPSKPIKIIVPFTAGGSSDVQGRMLADALSRLYGQSVIVDNRPGAGGHIGGKAVVDATPDGYTVLLGSIGLHATYGVYKKLPYDPSKDLKIVTVLAEMPHVVVATPSLPAKNLQELTALAKRQPDTVHFGSAGIGSSVHMLGELYKLASGAPIVHVPYKGSSAALNDLLGGQIQLMFENPPTVIPQVKNGKLKALAVSGQQRIAALPDVPTGIESGYPGFQATSWTTVAVGANVPDAIADKLNADIRKIVSAPEFRKGLEEQGMTAVANTRETARSFVAAEKVKWDKVIAQGKLNAD
ncbi:Bug family tripartite tricarboxylate transporter substrate binding protein [Ottowia flava]|uniref:Bug family tripartite tricarboxylate transporter substrate binding protein n=1 Tax=Ottowia flava TaxID=2675430 RepID=A0ABW4KV59_9BURK